MEVVKKAPTEKRCEWLMTTVRPSERRRIEEKAEQEKLSLSSYIRRAVLRDLARPIRENDWPEAAGR